MMTGIITRLITALNLTDYLDKNELSCPLHDKPGTKLEFISGNNVPDQIYFECTNRKCFRGNIIELIKKKKKVNTEKVFEMMYPGNILSGVFLGEESSDKNILLARLKDFRAHSQISDFMTACHKNLLKELKPLGFYEQIVC